MNVGLVVAGGLCLVLATGHTFVGRLVLGPLPSALHPTRFGDGALTRRAVVFTFYALSVMLTLTGAVLIAVAQGKAADDRGQVAFLVGAAYAAGAALLAWLNRRRPTDLLRAPVWPLMVAVTVLCLLNRSAV